MSHFRSKTFKNVQKSIIVNNSEGHTDTYEMIKDLMQKCIKNDVLLLNSSKNTSFLSNNDEVLIILNNFTKISTKMQIIAFAGFAKQFLDQDLQAARARVLITEPIEKLNINRTFHLIEDIIISETSIIEFSFVGEAISISKQGKLLKWDSPN